MLARPLFRERHRPDMSEEEATELLHEGLRVGTDFCLPYGFCLARALAHCNTSMFCCRCATTGTSRQPTSSRSPR